jgi:hypothetical protein
MFRAVSLVGILSLASVTVAAAQPPEPTTHTSFPRVIRITGTLPKPVGAPSPTETITFAIYAEETGGTPLWQETQTVIVDGTGAYTALLGSTVPDGLPLEIFTTYDARWLSIHLEGANEPDQSRVLIASVAYALRAADADTLGGKPASAYVLVDPPAGAPRTSDRTTSSSTAGTNASTTKAGRNASLLGATVGTPGHLGVFTDAFNLGDSVAVQSGARIGIGTVSPVDYLHVAFNDPYGAFTGLAVQNLSGNANAASGMLFYDQNGALAQFQGFNNTSHVYAINNIAKNGSNQFDGSIHFLIGYAPRLSVLSNGNVGIGTTAPAATLDVNGFLAVANNQQVTPLQVTSFYTGNTGTDPTIAPIAASFSSATAPGGLVGAAGTRALLVSGGTGGLGSGSSIAGGTGGIGLHVFGGLGGNSGTFSGGVGGTAIVATGGDAGGGATGSGNGGRGITTTGGAGGPGTNGGVGLFATGGPGGGGTGGYGAIINAGMGGTAAAQFNGNVSVNGTLSKSAGSFRIDHPLDPAHKYLSHSFVESPDMKNVYDGIAVLDANGVAWVELPEWFEALNRDFRYQLTAIGVPAPGLFIASEIQKNHFEIAGGQPGAKVSWLITGIRHDAYANAHRIPVEEAKPEDEQGTYLQPELYGQTGERNVSTVHVPDLRGLLEPSRRQ